MNNFNQSRNPKNSSPVSASERLAAYESAKSTATWKSVPLPGEAEVLDTQDANTETRFHTIEAAHASPSLKSPGVSSLQNVEDSPRSEASAAETAVAAEPILACRSLTKSYYKGDLEVPVLRGVDLEIETGKITSIIGQSGSGKSTLLHLLGTLDTPDAGEIFFETNRIDNISAGGRDLLRNRYFGMIFQSYHLLPELSMIENVLMPLMISTSFLGYWRQKKEFVQRATALLEMVGLSHRMTHKPSELSGGEMQRTAIARALINNPTLLLADEPTGNLDNQTGSEIIQLLKDLNKEHQLTIVMVTHDTKIAAESDRIVRICEGKIQAA